MLCRHIIEMQTNTNFKHTNTSRLSSLVREGNSSDNELVLIFRIPFMSWWCISKGFSYECCILSSRVKELGPGGPNDSPGGGDYPADLNLPPSPEKLPECLSPSNSDLAMLCTHNVRSQDLVVKSSGCGLGILVMTLWARCLPTCIIGLSCGVDLKLCCFWSAECGFRIPSRDTCVLKQDT